MELSKWDTRFMKLAFHISEWSSCIRIGRQVGALTVRDKRVLTTGYNGAPQKIMSCAERNECMRNKNKIESGTKQELCYAVHAEQNAIVQAAKLGISLDGATLYCTHHPCAICTKLIINSGITRVVYSIEYPDIFAKQLLAEAGIEVMFYDIN